MYKNKLFQHEGWNDASPVPRLVDVKPEVLDEICKQAAKVLKVETVRCVIEKYGADEYWRKFPNEFLEDRRSIGDGSAYYRTLMRKLAKAATKSVVPTVAAPQEQGPLKKSCVRQKMAQYIPSSYLPDPFAPPVKDSLVAVLLTEARCMEMGLRGFAKYEPLIARVIRVVDSETFECIWLQSQPTKMKDGEVPNGLTDGYTGKWSVWLQPDDEGEEAPPKSIVKSDDIYASNFKLSPDTQAMCSALQTVLKKLLVEFKSIGAEQAT